MSQDVIRAVTGTDPDAPLDLFPETRTPAAEPFALDFDLLARQGFFHPSEKPLRLALELRAIKRRLLRRLKFQKRQASKGPRPVEGEQRQPNLVLMTSTRPAEGKTFTSINLALSLAVEDNIGTILIDADVPRPKVRAHLGLPPTLGFTDLIDRRDELNMRECLRRDLKSPFALLPEGTWKGRATELYSREEAGAVLREISARFPERIIIVDAPPVLATPEAVILARHVDEVIFVVEANATPEPAVAAALDEILDVNPNVSLVLNRCLVSDGAIHYGSYEEYYYRQDRDRA